MIGKSLGAVFFIAWSRSRGVQTQLTAVAPSERLWMMSCMVSPPVFHRSATIERVDTVGEESTRLTRRGTRFIDVERCSALLTPTDGLPVLAVRQAFNVLAGSPDADAAGRLALFRDVVTQLKTAVAATAASTAAAAVADSTDTAARVTAAAAATAPTTAAAAHRRRRPTSTATPSKP